MTAKEQAQVKHLADTIITSMRKMQKEVEDTLSGLPLTKEQQEYMEKLGGEEGYLSAVEDIDTAMSLLITPDTN